MNADDPHNIKAAVVARTGPGDEDYAIFLDGDPTNFTEGNVLDAVYFMERYAYTDFLVDFEEREHYLRCAHLLQDRLSDLESRMKEAQSLMHELLFGDPQPT